MEEQQILQKINLDFARAGIPPRVFAKQGDNNMRVVAVSLYNDGKAYKVPGGYAVNVSAKKPDGKSVYNPATEVAGNVAYITLTQQMLLVLVDDMVGVDVLAWANADTRAVLTSMGIKSLGLAEFFCVVYVLYEATSIMKNMLLCGLPLPAGLREKVAKFLDTMTDETAINMQAEISGTNKGHTVTGHLDTAQLETMSLEALHKLADGLEVEYTEDTPLKQLAEKIAAVEITTGI